MNKLRTAYWPTLTDNLTKEMKDELIATANRNAAKILFWTATK